MSARRIILAAVLLAGVLILVAITRGLPPSSVSFAPSEQNVDAYDFVEITARVSAPHAINPFRDSTFSGTFATTSGRTWQVDGFCDSPDGSIYRIRFMPPVPGEYTYHVAYQQGWSTKTSSGTFHTRDARRRGPIRIDPQNRWHFIWEGTGEHYFFNGTTAYWLMGWKDEQVIRASLERLHRLKINRIRVTVAGRTNVFYGEPVMPGPSWTPYLTPWPAGKGDRYLHLLGRAGQRLGLRSAVFDSLANLGMPEDIYHPGFDYSRFDVDHWQKLERALRFARDRDMIISLVLDMNDSRSHPAPGSADEQQFIRYAVARFAAFSNITWDLGDDLDHYRDDRWTHITGTRIKAVGPIPPSRYQPPDRQRPPGSDFRLVRLHLISGVVATAARIHACPASAATATWAHHPADERGVRLRRSLPLVVQRVGIRISRHIAKDGLGNRDGRWLPDHG